MLKCKCCKKSNFGAILTETKVTPIMMSNGEPVKVLTDQEDTTTNIAITYCMTCKKEINPETDLYELETCPVCGKEVEELVDGLCHECAEQKKSLESMSKDDLLLMILKQQMASGKVSVGKKSKNNNDNAQEGAKKQKENKNVKEEVANDVAATTDEEVDINSINDEEVDIINAIDDVDINALKTYDDDGEIF